MVQPTKTAPRPVVDMQSPPPVDNLPAPRPRTVVQPIVPSNWQEITAIASAICRASMAPKSYCKTDNYGKLVYVDGKPVPEPEKVAVAIMHGMEVGLTPMASLQSIAVINGMPSIWGDGMMAVIRASGLLEDMQEGLEIDKNGMPQVAWCKVKRRGEPSWKERSLTWPEVLRSGWAKKEGPWTSVPGRMMTIRVRGWLLRDMFSDVLRGLHSAEEMEDIRDVTQQGTVVIPDVPPAEPKRSDPKYQSAGVSPDTAPGSLPADKQPEPVTPTSQQDGGNSEAGGGIRDSGGQPESAPGPAAGRAATVTDVADLNEAPAAAQSDAIPTEPEPLSFEIYKTYGDLIEFSDQWLSEPGRTREQAMQWHEHYKKQLEAGLSPKYNNAKVKEALTELLALYGKVIAEPQE